MAAVSIKPKIVLQVPILDQQAFARFVETCIRDHVELISVVGPGCEEVHNQIDDILVNAGENPPFIATTWHEDETLDEAVEFAKIYGDRGAEEVQVVSF